MLPKGTPKGSKVTTKGRKHVREGTQMGTTRIKKGPREVPSSQIVLLSGSQASLKYDMTRRRDSQYITPIAPSPLICSMLSKGLRP